jgi:predicted hotdog family 3-hydroxylacyl-ACP dehydratase
MNSGITDIDILTLLPQRPPFVMVDKLTNFSMDKVETSFTICENNLFCENGFFSETGIIENIAQTCAARMGYINAHIHHEHVKIGYIGSIRNLEIFSLPRIGSILHTSVEVIEEVFQMTLIKAVVKSNDEVLASGEMKISVTNIDKTI